MRSMVPRALSLFPTRGFSTLPPPNTIVWSESSLKALDPAGLALALREASRLYYEGRPAISDDLFEAMQEALRAQTPDSEALREVGSEPLTDRVACKFVFLMLHYRIMLLLYAVPYRMGSLNKLTPGDKGRNGIRIFKEKFSGPFCVTDKLDGYSYIYTIYSFTICALRLTYVLF